MTAPVMRTAGVVTGWNSGSSTTRTVNLPTHSPGETLYIALVDDEGSQVFTVPGDWTRVIDSENVFNNVSTFLLIQKVAGGSEPSSINITVATSERAVWIAFAVQGDNGFDVAYTSNTGATSSTAQTPAITTTVADVLVVSFVGTDGVTTPHGTPSTYTRLTEVSFTSAGSLSINYQTVASPATVSAQNSSLSISKQWRGWAIAIKPVSGTAYNQNVGGTIAPTGAVTKSTHRNLAGGLTPAGTVHKLISRILAGGITPTGLVHKLTTRLLAGTVGSSGALVSAKVLFKSLGGTVGLSGALVKQTTKVLGGAITPQGGLLKRLARALGGSITPTGSLTAQKIVFVFLGGTIGIAGTVTKQTRRVLGGVIAPVGALLKKTFKFLGGTIGISGSLTKLDFEIPPRFLRRGPIYSQKGLSFLVGIPAWGGTNSISKDVSADVVSYDHSSTSMGGFWSASIGLRLPLSEMEDWLANGIGRQITVKGGAQVVAWEGIVDRVTLSVGGYDISVGPFMEIVNKLKIAYSMFLQLGGGNATGIRVVSDWMSNSSSIARYGIQSRVFSAGGIDPSEVTGLQEMLLERYSNPSRREDLSLPGNTGERYLDVKLECVGYVHLLQKYVYNSTTTGLQNLSAKIADILNAEPNGLFSKQQIQLNTTQVPAYEQDDAEAWGEIKKLVSMGNSSQDRSVFGVYEGRRVLFKSSSPDIVYIRPLREGANIIQDSQGGLLQPWQVRPGSYVLVADLLPGRMLPANLEKDLRVLYAETVQYQQPDSLVINGAHSFRIEQKLAQLGLSGIS